MPQKLTVQLTGRINNLIFYKLGDKDCVRTVPQRVKQTKATKASGKLFGIAARAGKAIRQQVLPVIPFPADNKMQTRLVSAIYQYLKSPEGAATASNNELPFIIDYTFTEGYTLAERWQVKLTVTEINEGIFELSIPAFIPAKSISAPAGTVSVTCNIAIAGFTRATGIAAGGFSTSLHFDHNEIEVPAQVVALPIPRSGGSVIVTAASFEYNTIKNGIPGKMKNKAFMPSDIISAVYKEAP
jgi:hypothetical protein